MGGFKLTRNRIIAVILAVICLIMLFFGWISVGGETRKNWAVVSQRFDYYASQIEAFAKWYGIDININRVKRVVRALGNGRLSPGEIFTVSGDTRAVIKELDKAGYFYSSDLSKVTGALTGYRILFVVTLIAVLFAIYTRLTGKMKALDFLMFLFVALLFIFIAIACGEIKKKGLNVGITAFSIIALICALPRALLDKLPFMKDKAGAILEKVGIKHRENVQCSVCGADLDSRDKFCPRCGAAVENRTETVVCRRCGSRIPSDSAFCVYCGRKFE